MKASNALFGALAILCNAFCGCGDQQIYGTGFLKLARVIYMPDVRGRLDHLDVNLKDQLVYVAALGNNTLEVADLKNGKIVHSIRGLNEPQGLDMFPKRMKYL